jgi:phosphoribosylformylglycinamidine synthase subunit PurS
MLRSAITAIARAMLGAISAPKAGDHPSRSPARMEHQAMQVRVLVRLKPGVLDPQGRAVHHALEGLGFAGVADVRIGRLIELDLADGTDDATIRQMCEKLLANTVIESFTIEGTN